MASCRVSVAAPSGVVDLVLPATTPLVTFMPAVADIAGLRGVAPGSPVLCRVDGSTLDTAMSLTDNGITEGDVLVLTCAQPPPMRQPSFDAARTLVRPAPMQAASSAGAIAATVACGSIGLAAIAFAGWSGDRLASVAAATTAVVGTVIGGFAAQRVPAPVLCGTVALLCGAAGSLAVPGGPAAANALLGVTAAATVAVLAAHLTHMSTAWVVAVTVIAAAVSTVTVAAVLTGHLAAVGVGLTLVALCCLSAAARIALTAAGISVPENGFGVRHAERASQARDITTGLAIGFSVLAGIGVAVTSLGTYLHDESRWGAVAFGATVSAALLLRMRSDSTHGAASATGGLVGSGAVVTLVAAFWPGCGAWLGAALIAAPTAVWMLNTSNAFHSPTVTRCLDILGSATLTATVPLAFWVCGLYGFARGLSLP